MSSYVLALSYVTSMCYRNFKSCLANSKLYLPLCFVFFLGQSSDFATETLRVVFQKRRLNVDQSPLMCSQ